MAQIDTLSLRGLVLSVTLFLLLVSTPALARTELNFEEADGLFEVRQNTLTAITADFVFWKKRWEWAGAKIVGSPNSSRVYAFDGSIQGLSMSIKGTAVATTSREMVWNFELSPQRSQDEAFGGIAFKFNPDVFNSVQRFGEPELLPGNSGWRLATKQRGEYLTVRFDPPLASIYFERGRKGEIRAYFYIDGFEAGPKQVRMTVTLPEDGKVVPTLGERLGPGPDKNWYRDALYWATSPVDLSYLNETEKPAGKRGFLKARGEALAFEDGTKVPFWGINLMASALFRTNSVEVKRHARRLSELGFNLVRIHHHDSAWVRPNVFGSRADGTLDLDDEALKKLDWWIKAFKDEGIYVWLDLNVGREFTAEDGVRNFDEIAKGKTSVDARGFTHINSTLQARLMEFQATYLNHVNSYTSLAYKDDPAIIALLVTNENDLTHHFGNRLLPNKNVPLHNAIYMSEASAFAARNRLPIRQTWRSWEHGPSKLFLNDLEHRFNEKMLGNLSLLGVKVPVATTQSWGHMPISSLPALTDSDIIDVHSYGGPNEVESNPRYRAGLLAWIAAVQVAGKPLSVSEWNLSPFPAFDRGSLPLQVAAMARLQAWDASMQYGYAQAPLNSAGRPSNWHAFNDPASLAMMPAAALIFRKGHVSEAHKTYALKLDPQTFFYKEISPETSAAIRTIAEQSRLVIELPETPELPWLKPNKAPDDAIIVTDPDKDYLPEGQNLVRSDTGEIYRNWEDGIFTINTGQSQVAAGWLGSKSVMLKDISVELETKNASIAVQSLNDEPISTSHEILISMAARSIPSPGNKLPFLSEPVVGKLEIRAAEGLKLFALDRAGNEKQIPVRFEAGRYKLDLDHNLGTYWLKLRAPKEAGRQ